MAGIQDYLELIRNAIYGKDVRQAIHDGIQQCYYDGRAGSTDLEARQRLDVAEVDITSLGGRMNNAETNINTIEGRVDSFTHLSEGSTTGDAELIDGRTVGGVTYTNIGNAIRAVNDNLGDELNLFLNASVIVPFYKGKYIDLEHAVTMQEGFPQPTADNATWDCSVVSCSKGDRFIINGTGGWGPRLWGFINSSGAVIESALGSSTAENLEMVAPVGSAFLIINDKTKATSFKGENVNYKINDMAINANLGRYGIYTLTRDDIEQGGLTDGRTIVHASRLRSRTEIAVKVGDIITFTSGIVTANMSIARYNVEGNWISTSSWQVSGYQWECAADGFVKLSFKNSGGTEITPSQFDATVQIISKNNKIYTGYDNEVQSSKIRLILTSDNDIEIVNSGVELQLKGTQCFILGLKSSARKSFTFDTIASQLPSYCTVNDSGLRITMPANGVFGFDVSTEQFVMKTGETAAYAVSDNFAPLYYRYYNTVFGELVDRYIYKKVINTVESKTLVRQSFNSAYHEGVTDFSTKCKQFCYLMYGDDVTHVDAPTDIEPFLFFTDPHLAMFSGWEDEFCEKLACIQKYYNSTPTSFCLCGGDWLGVDDLPAEACFRLGYIDGVMRSMFDNSYMLVGNHDTNYIGKITPDAAQYTTKLSNESIANLWYRKDRKAYFKFRGDRTTFYCFDTGVEAQNLDSQDDYGYRQLGWFADELLSDNSEHIALAAHILYWSHEEDMQPLTAQVLSIAQAYNNRESIYVNQVLHDYENATGKIEFALFGHLHEDYNTVINGIPCIITSDVRKTISPTFDLVMADYTNRKLYCVRVGSGSDRTISLV